MQALRHYAAYSAKSARPAIIIIIRCTEADEQFGNAYQVTLNIEVRFILKKS